jgi:hypothetical protein
MHAGRRMCWCHGYDHFNLNKWSDNNDKQVDEYHHSNNFNSKQHRPYQICWR